MSLKVEACLTRHLFAADQTWESFEKAPFLDGWHFASEHVYGMDFWLSHSNFCMLGMDTWNERHCHILNIWVC